MSSMCFRNGNASSLKKKCPLFFLSCSVIIILLWDALLYLHNILMQYVMAIVLSKESNWHGFSILICAQYISFALFGLLADVWIGRYKAILIGIVLCFISWIIIGTCYTVNFTYHFPNPLYWCAYTIVYVFETIGYCSFRANIVQYNIDQLIGASANELNAVIYWHSVPLVFSTMTFELSQCLFNLRYFLLATFIISGLAVALTLVSHSFFKHKLENISLIKNPIKLIVRVLCYARKHKYPENRSALTYWEEEAPSRLDLGKDKYGGPFTEEEVEDVKTFFRMIPLLIVLCGFVISDDYRHIMSSKPTILSCIVSTDFGYMSSIVFVLLIYLFLIRPIFSKYVPRILTRLISGLIIALCVLLSELFIFKFYSSSTHINEMLLVSKILLAMTYSLIVPALLEFTVAQSPVHMRGVMVGLWYAFWGIGCFGNITFKVLFSCYESVCTSFYYYITKSVLVLIILIVFVILAKRYKYRVRENEVNVVQIVDDHYQRYMEQEKQYYNQEDLLSFSE